MVPTASRVWLWQRLAARDGVIGETSTKMARLAYNLSAIFVTPVAFSLL